MRLFAKIRDHRNIHAGQAILRIPRGLSERQQILRRTGHELGLHDRDHTNAAGGHAHASNWSCRRIEVNRKSRSSFSNRSSVRCRLR
jgi:hypothetical protein